MPRARPAAPNLASSRARAARAATELRTVQLGLDDRPSVDVVIRRSVRTRHVRIRVDEQGTVSVSAPRRFGVRRIDGLVADRAAWIHDVLTRMEEHARVTEVDVSRGQPTRVLGELVPTHVVTATSRRSSARLSSGRIELSVAPGDDAHDVLRQWYRQYAADLFAERCAAWAAQFGLQYGRITIREQRTRWGSCSSAGNLAFNWRLVLAPIWVVDSIIVHELCHIAELNHSPAFWALLDERYPRHHEASEWLREHGASLRISRPSGPNVTPAEPPARPALAPTSVDAGAEPSQLVLFDV